MRSMPLFALAVTILAADPDGASLFKARCASCHTDQPAERTPARAELARLTPELVINEMVNGKMKLQANGLAEDERRAIATFITAKELGGTAAALPGACTGAPKPFNPGPGDWNGWGVDMVNSRYQPLPGLKAGDVPRLKLKWALGFPGDTRSVTQPAIVGGRVFAGSSGGTVFSLDAATGCIYWTYKAGGIVRSGINVVRAPNGRNWIVCFGDSNAVTHAVDALTGKEIWKVKVDDHPLARITGSPAYYQGRLYVPVSSGEELGSQAPKYECCTFRGSVSAIDAATGKVIWKTYSITDPPRPYRKNAEGTQLHGPAGAGIWSAPTIDAKRKRIYVGTGNSYTGVEIPTSDAVMALDLASGSMLWVNQVTPRDNWVPGCPKSVNCPENPGDDYDFASSPILRAINGKEVLVAGQKSGVIYGLDPDQRGKILWQTRVGQGSGMVGAIGFGMASDGANIFAAVGDIGRRDGTPGLYGLRSVNGERTWSTPAPQNAGAPGQGAAVSAMPGIAFSGSWGGHLRAYSTTTGEIVWDFNAIRDFETINRVPARGGAFNGGGPAISRGIVITASGYGFAGGAPGNVLLAFGVE
jgi:polyvinyl alcohol dehydrogenase (cytochrome)